MKILFSGQDMLAFPLKVNRGRIFGFHPTAHAVEAAGGFEKSFELLRQRKTLDGKLHDDSHIFIRAYALSQHSPTITVWQMTFNLSDEEFERVRSQTLAWYNQGRNFAYSFPRKDAMPNDRDNCATFPRRLGLPLPEMTGQLYWYIAKLKEQGEKWEPKGNADD